MKLHCLFMRKSGGRSLVERVQNFYVFTIKLGLCCQPLPSPHTILHLHQMKDDEGAGLWGSRSEVNSRIIRSFHFYISGKDTFRLNTMNQAYYTFHTLSFHFFTRNLYGEWKLI